MFEVGKTYRIKDNEFARSIYCFRIGIRNPNTALIITKVTSRTIWFRTIPDENHYGETYLYKKEFSQLAEETSAWAGSKLNFNFVH